MEKLLRILGLGISIVLFMELFIWMFDGAFCRVSRENIFLSSFYGKFYKILCKIYWTFCDNELRGRNHWYAPLATRANKKISITQQKKCNIKDTWKILHFSIHLKITWRKKSQHISQWATEIQQKKNRKNVFFSISWNFSIHNGGEWSRFFLQIIKNFPAEKVIQEGFFLTREKTWFYWKFYLKSRWEMRGSQRKISLNSLDRTPRTSLRKKFNFLFAQWKTVFTMEWKILTIFSLGRKTFEGLVYPEKNGKEKQIFFKLGIKKESIFPQIARKIQFN